jgi:1,5-anhydro-D-fructose reductase (1,5-anhydro-D-mannitol-forming)
MRWGLVGIGQHADRRVGPAFRRAADADLVAVWSRDRERGRVFAERHGVEAWFTSLDDLMRRPDLDAIYVSSPHGLHRAHVTLGAMAGKHVLCEKPLALKVEDAEAMVTACHDAGVRLGVCFQNRYHPAHRKMRELVLSGAAGKIIHASCHYGKEMSGPWTGWRSQPWLAGAGEANGLGALTGLALHALDLLRFVTGEEAREVIAMMDDEAMSGGTESDVSVLIRLSGGGLAEVGSSSRSRWYQNEVIIQGERARFTGFGTVGTLLGGRFVGESDDHEIKEEYTDCAPETALYTAAIEDFTTWTNSGGLGTSAGEDGLIMTQWVEAILSAAQTGRIVSVSAAHGKRGATPRRSLAVD